MAKSRKRTSIAESEADRPGDNEDLHHFIYSNLANGCRDYFDLSIAPAEIESIPIVSAFRYEVYQGNDIPGVTLVDNGASVSDQAGKFQIRHLAATQALENAVSPSWAEFGVAQGKSAYFLSKYLPEDGKFFLFDSFEGLPEDWVHGKTTIINGVLFENNVVRKGAFACKVPDYWLTDPRLIFVKGWFEDTLPMADDIGPLGFIHIDSDIYSSAKTIFERCDHQILPGTVILFDDFWGYENYREHEYKALHEWGRKFKYLARDTACRVAIEICE